MDNRIVSSTQTMTVKRAARVVVSVVIATGKRPDPFRTRKLSLTAPMVLHPPGCGRVGHHRAHTTQLAREPPTTAAPGQLLYTPTNKTTTHKQQKPGWIQDRSDIGVRNGAPLSP